MLLVTGRFNAARDILQAFNRYCRNGLIPNYVADKSGEPAYNTVDGTLWYINAVLQYLKYTGDYPFVEAELWSNLQTIISSHEKGTGFGIGLDSDGLLGHGARLTWMDAEVNGEAVTPRAGKSRGNPSFMVQRVADHAAVGWQVRGESFGREVR